jgi:hypothetical protein
LGIAALASLIKTIGAGKSFTQTQKIFPFVDRGGQATQSLLFFYGYQAHSI